MASIWDMPGQIGKASGKFGLQRQPGQPDPLAGYAGSLLAGQGVPSEEQLFAREEPGIRQEASLEARQRAADLAKRGLARSGFSARALSGVGEQQARQLAAARMRAQEQAYAGRQRAAEFGGDVASQLADFQQRQALLGWMESQGMTPYGVFQKKIKDYLTPSGVIGGDVEAEVARRRDEARRAILGENTIMTTESPYGYGGPQGL